MTAEEKGVGAVVMVVPFHKLAEVTGNHVDMRFGHVLDPDTPILVNADGTMKVRLPGGTAFIDTDPDPMA